MEMLVDDTASPAMLADLTTSVVQRASALVVCVNLICGTTVLAVGLMATRFVLKLLATSPPTGLARLAYAVTDPVVAPFAALLGDPAVTGGQVEVPALMAMAVCGLVGSLFAMEVLLLHRRVTPS
jgi:hypothetical protein